MYFPNKKSPSFSVSAAEGVVDGVDADAFVVERDDDDCAMLHLQPADVVGRCFRCCRPEKANAVIFV